MDEQNSYLAFTGGKEGAGFALSGEVAATPDGTRQMRMVFSEITPASFKWRWESTADGGKSWRASLFIDYQRSGAGPAPPGPAAQ